VSSFYDWAILAGRFDGSNPIARVTDRALLRAADRHRPFLAGISRQPATRRALQVKTIRRLPRPLDTDQVKALLEALRCRRDLALVRLMLDGGLRPGEALGLHLGDVAYGRRRVTIRHREDHPRGVRQKSRTERVVDLHEAATLEAVADYVMRERPADAATPLLFLVGGRGRRRREPLSYAALARLFARACARAGVRAPWVTPHSLRHTHATRMWEMGMRELTLQRRLGHASPESTRVYTRVSDPQVVAEYQRALGLDAAAGDGRPEGSL
jgi:integrase